MLELTLPHAKNIEQRIQILVPVLIVNSKAQALQVTNVSSQLGLSQFLKRRPILREFFSHAEHQTERLVELNTVVDNKLKDEQVAEEEVEHVEGDLRPLQKVLNFRVVNDVLLVLEWVVLDNLARCKLNSEHQLGVGQHDLFLHVYDYVLALCQECLVLHNNLLSVLF